MNLTLGETHRYRLMSISAKTNSLGNLLVLLLEWFHNAESTKSMTCVIFDSTITFVLVPILRNSYPDYKTTRRRPVRGGPVPDQARHRRRPVRGRQCSLRRHLRPLSITRPVSDTQGSFHQTIRKFSTHLCRRWDPYVSVGQEMSLESCIVFPASDSSWFTAL